MAAANSHNGKVFSDSVSEYQESARSAGTTCRFCKGR
jgi:hypothetical protein